MLSPSPDSSGNLPILENKALAVAFLNRELGVDSGKQLLKKIKKITFYKKAQSIDWAFIWLFFNELQRLCLLICSYFYQVNTVF